MNVRDLAEKYLWKAKGAAIYPVMSGDAISDIQALLNISMEQDEQIVACKREPSGVLGTTGNWVLTNQRLVVMRYEGLLDLPLDQIAGGRLESGFLGKTVYVKTVDNRQYDIAVDDEARFCTFLEELTQLEGAERAAPALKLAWEEPRIQLLRAVINAQLQKQAISDAEAERRRNSITLLQSVLINGREQHLGRWVSPVSAEDIVAILPRVRGHALQNKKTVDDVDTYVTGEGFGSDLGRQLLGRMTFGLSHLAEAGMDAADAASTKLGKPLSLDVGDGIHLILEVTEHENQSVYRYLHGVEPLCEYAPESGAEVAGYMRHAECRALLLRWVHGEGTMRTLLQRTPAQTVTALGELGVKSEGSLEVDVAGFYADLTEWHFEWAPRLSAYLPRQIQEEWKEKAEEAGANITLVKPTAPRVPKPTHPASVGGGYTRFAGVIQMASALGAMCTTLIAWFVAFIVVIVMFGERFTLLPFATCFMWVSIPMAVTLFITGFLTMVAPVTFRYAFYVGLVMEVGLIPLGAPQNLFTIAIEAFLHHNHLSAWTAALKKVQDPKVSADGDEPILARAAA